MIPQPMPWEIPKHCQVWFQTETKTKNTDWSNFWRKNHKLISLTCIVFLFISCIKYLGRIWLCPRLTPIFKLKDYFWWDSRNYMWCPESNPGGLQWGKNLTPILSLQPLIYILDLCHHFIVCCLDWKELQQTLLLPSQAKDYHKKTAMFVLKSVEE